MSKQINTPDLVVRVEKSGVRFNAWDTDGVKRTSEITTGARKKAHEGNYLLGRFTNKAGKFYWRRWDGEAVTNTPTVSSIDVPTDHTEVMNFIHSSYTLKPKSLVMSELKWKYLIRSAVRGKNIMMTGPAGCGKTMAAKSVVNSLDRPDFYFNLGATQDPRATLIGNVHFNNKTGTYFSESHFVKAIQTPNSVILLDDTEEHGLLQYMFPNVDSKVLKDVATIAHMTRVESNNETARISSGISTRTSVEMAGLLYDGFGLEESANVCVYPQYDSTGGVDSERTFVKQIVQKFIDDGSGDELFSEEEIEESV